MGKLPNQEITSEMMSLLDGSQIQKPIIPAFPIPFWQNSTSVFGSKILTSIVQEKQTNIPLASDSNPESNSDSDSDMVEGIVGSSSNSSELNDSGDQAADRQQLEQETIPESSTSRYGRKRTRVLRENYVPWNNIHVDTQ